ncbi:hypothetical protein [Finch poxvirus]|uniref:IMV membrane protein n=1 Tax=Condorpox virus TaxID=3049970 RepID=A0AAT9UQ28_9POXV|nr:hypothetical protein [Finch poxvirus]UOX38796.1 hypothetical protein [Finch poxvirus]UOX38950.1 hypothetical protein [Finch poxvirus]UOX39131.1 hypothetical protein [Finch poxvirus]
MDSEKQNPDSDYLLISLDYGNGEKVYYTKNPFSIMLIYFLFFIILLSVFTALTSSYICMAIMIVLLTLLFINYNVTFSIKSTPIRRH